LIQSLANSKSILSLYGLNSELIVVDSFPVCLHEGSEALSSQSARYVIYQKLMYSEYGKRLPKEIKDRINLAVESDLKVNPYGSESLKVSLRGLRSYQLRGGYRIIFAICKECRKGGFTRLNNCEDCSKHPDNTVMLFLCGSHDIYKEMERLRRLS
jgi:hypothetical protein